jgi:hypothetical protein
MVSLLLIIILIKSKKNEVVKISYIEVAEIHNYN